MRTGYRRLVQKNGPIPTTGLWGGAGLSVCVVCAVTAAGAMVARLTPEQREAASALILTGVVTDIRAAGDAGGDRFGLILVDLVLKGDPATETVPLRLPAANGPRSAEDIDYPPGTSGLWFLREVGPRAPGLYAADHPQRFVPEDRMQPELAALSALLGPDAGAD